MRPFSPVKFILPILALSSLLLGGLYFWRSGPADPIAVQLAGPPPAQTLLTATPRAPFTPTPPTRRGYYNIDIIGDFTAPATKSITFCGAGRNLHVQQDRNKLLRRGFTAINQTRMIPDVERWLSTDSPPKGWKSSLSINQRSLIIYRNYFLDSFGLDWAKDGNLAAQTTYRAGPAAPNARPNRNTLYQASMELIGGCVGFGDCPPGGWKNTFGTIFLDIENDGVNRGNEQEQANIYTFLAKTIKDNVSPQTKVGSIMPVPHNSYGNSAANHYTAEPEWLWNMPARHTATSRQRGMPDAIVGKSFADYVDFQMPGTYYMYPDFDYSIKHTGDGDRHWLASLLAEQEVNRRLSPKPRIAWHWLFNTQSSEFANSGKAEHPAPPAVAEGMAVFYWFTGAYGVLFWDDHDALTPDQPSPADPNLQNLGNDRRYTCYEHYIHGMWRLFRHHGDLFNGRETYLNEATDCSYDGGKTWVSYNANQIKTRDLPFARAIVNGDQILIAATKPYAQPQQTNQVMVRYVQNGYSFYTTISLKGDGIYLGRATMKKADRSARS